MTDHTDVEVIHQEWFRFEVWKAGRRVKTFRTFWRASRLAVKL